MKEQDHDYNAAYAEAVEKARATGLDVGIERKRCPIRGRDVYTVRFLPKPENRQGHELRCEVVTPKCPRIQP